MDGDAQGATQPRQQWARAARAPRDTLDRHRRAASTEQHGGDAPWLDVRHEACSYALPECLLDGGADGRVCLVIGLGFARAGGAEGCLEGSHDAARFKGASMGSFFAAVGSKVMA